MLQCYQTHKPFPLGAGVVAGGSCVNPAIKDADVYLGLSLDMRVNESHRPWAGMEVVQALYPMTDMEPPKDPTGFKLLIDWLAANLSMGRKVHVGCQGGHGRTGTVLAALVAHVAGEADAIEWVRENYCKRAVESQAQVDFLVKHFGVAAAKPCKTYAPATASGGGWPTGVGFGQSRPVMRTPVLDVTGEVQASLSYPAVVHRESVSVVRSSPPAINRSIWGALSPQDTYE